MIIREAMDFAIDQAILERASNTVRAYRLGASVFKEFLLDNKVDPEHADTENLSIDLFIRFPSYLVSKYERPTAAVYMAAVMYIWKWFLIEDWIKPNYNQTIRLQKAIETARFTQNRNTRMPARGSMEKMIAAVEQMNEPEPRKSRDIALVHFLASSGCRNSEATSLMVKDLDFAERQAFIDETKGDKSRLAFFSQEAATALKKYFELRGFAGKNDPVFCRHDKGAGKQHKPVTGATVRNVINQVSMVAGIDQFTPHYFRHAFAIKSLEESGNLALVQDLLGHATPQTTRVYAKIYDEDLRAAHHRIFG